MLAKLRACFAGVDVEASNEREGQTIAIAYMSSVFSRTYVKRFEYQRSRIRTRTLLICAFVGSIIFCGGGYRNYKKPKVKCSKSCVPSRPVRAGLAWQAAGLPRGSAV